MQGKRQFDVYSSNTDFVIVTNALSGTIVLSQNYHDFLILTFFFTKFTCHITSATYHVTSVYDWMESMLHIDDARTKNLQQITLDFLFVQGSGSMGMRVLTE